MMRPIEISTDVFAAIWAARKDGEESENEILERLFGLTSNSNMQFLNKTQHEEIVVDGYFDSRNKVHFFEGFRAYRFYKGEIFGAVATKGQWLRIDNGLYYPSLNKLNESIVAGSENIWNGNWMFNDERGMRRSIDELRN